MAEMPDVELEASLEAMWDQGFAAGTAEIARLREENAALAKKLAAGQTLLEGARLCGRQDRATIDRLRAALAAGIAECHKISDRAEAELAKFSVQQNEYTKTDWQARQSVAEYLGTFMAMQLNAPMESVTETGEKP